MIKTISSFIYVLTKFFLLFFIKRIINHN